MMDGSAQYLDNPRLRWRRIGLPALAALFSAGDDRFTDVCYVSVQLVFIFVGTWWLSLYAHSAGWHPAIGLLFLLIPAVLVSIDRMTVDLALAALCIGFVWHASGALPVPVYCILVLAPLIRETGLVLIIGWCVWRWSIKGAVCAIPALAWWLYVHAHTAPDGTAWLSRYPFSGLLDRTFSPEQIPAAGLWLRSAAAAENLALAGIWLAMLFGVYVLGRRRALPEITAALFVAFASVLGRYDIWDSAYAAGRTMSPLLVMLTLVALRDRQPLYASPVLLILPRLALQYQAQLAAAWRP